ncbi:MAG: 2-C-methyl-D-erythritol 2,4-cyclodiphosphate synthase [Bacteroidales bacterium]|nr:2-C-methyl-D-erythritol 2,4-cyclodiphosphate synthase [Bacteroidales bacterium]
MKIRTGIGYDVHQLKEGLPLWLGGIQVEHTKGLVGHSDADVLIHAICDALLGAAALGDIGKHFPDNDPAYKGIDSKILLRRVCELLESKEYTVSNIDAILIMQKPKVAAYIPIMQQTLADIIKIDTEDVSIKATTTEHLGFEGREEGISAMASVLIIQR